MNLRRVYITGADCTGKSTWAAAHSAATGIPVTKFSYTPDQQKQELLWKQYENIVRSDEPIILDRGWHGAFCYHGILGEQPYDTLRMISLSRQFVHGGGTIMMFVASFRTMCTRYAGRGDEFVSERDFGAIIQRYDALRELLTAHGVPFYLIDTSRL